MHNLFKIKQSVPELPTVFFKCPFCNSKVDLKYVVEKKGQFGCVDCIKKVNKF